MRSDDVPPAAEACVHQGYRLVQGRGMLPMQAQQWLVRVLLNNGMHADQHASLRAHR
jgi:hypothetical protein